MSKKVKNVYSSDFKTKLVLLVLKEDKTISELASYHSVDLKSLRDWKKDFIENASYVFNRKAESKPYKEEVKSLELTQKKLYKEIGQLTVELNLVKKVREYGL
ncbi:MAG: transposase [Candidatus Sericytochromatia bacterium]